jgi:hypothetical protein
MARPALVLIHGRSQQGNEPGVLQRDWMTSLRAGLGPRADYILDGVEIRFAFYGDVLDEWVVRTSLALSDGARGSEATIDTDFLAFQAEVAGEVLARHGVDAQAQQTLVGCAARNAGARSPEWVRALLRLLDGLPGVTGLFIASVMRDVYLYLNNAAARHAVDAIVGPTIRGNCVVVAHSLGTVVAYRLLKTAVAPVVPLFMTIGSPLGIGPIRQTVVPRRFPTPVKRWVNVFDDRDDVALYALGRGRFTVEPPNPIEDIGGIDNRTDNHHGIVEYLNKPAVALEIAQLLEPGTI